MVEQIVPVLKVADAARSVEWYTRIGFEKDFENRYSEEFPGYVGISRNGMAMHLSERVGDATPDTLVRLFVEDVDALAAELGEELVEDHTGREIHLTDPDGNRIRIGAPLTPAGATANGSGSGSAESTDNAEGAAD